MSCSSGSLRKPNVEAVEHIVYFAEKLPDTLFMVMGELPGF
ncbi:MULTISPECIES: hypothetical protein [Paenibacillus]|nr:hypothetical protein [Paenibacillus tyrfis]